jgi:antitoxin MazE
MSSMSGAVFMGEGRVVTKSESNYNVRMKTKIPRRKSTAASPSRRGRKATGAAGRPLTAKLIRIGNSRGVRLPKAVIEQAGLVDEVEIAVRGDEVVLRPGGDKPVRAGWDEAFKEALAALPADFLERERAEWAEWQNAPNEFDKEGWTW